MSQNVPTESDQVEGLLATASALSKKRICCARPDDRLEMSKAILSAVDAATSEYWQVDESD